MIKGPGLYHPFAYAARGNTQGAGERPVGLLADSAFTLQQHIKSFYYNYTIACDVWDGAMSTTTEHMSAVGVTRRFFNWPNRSPGMHKTYREKNRIIQPNVVEDLLMDFTDATYSYNAKLRRWMWYPRIVVRAVLQDPASGASFTLNQGGADGLLDFGQHSDAAWATPLVQSVGLGATLTSPGLQVSNVVVLASIKPIERYDMIHFSPLSGPAGTVVTITIPPVSQFFNDTTVREGFSHVKEVSIGDQKITAFNPFTGISGQYKETVKVTIPAGSRTGAFQFIAGYTPAGKDDVYHTWRDFIVV